MDRKPVVQQPKTDHRRLGLQAKSLFKGAKAGRPRLVRLRRQHPIKQLGEQPSSSFDELRVNAWNIELTQVQAGAGMVAEPGEDRQYAVPVGRMVQQRERPARNPLRKRGKSGESQLGALVETSRFLALADQS